MKITGTLLAITAFASIAFGSIANANSYVTAFGGGNWDDVSSPISSDTGYVVGGAVGMNVKSVPGLRAELEVSYRQNDVSVFKFIHASHETTAVMGNLAYDFDAGLGAVKPYVLAGVGYGRNKGVIENVSLLSLESSGFAWQLGAGVNAKVAEGVTLGVGYRYLQTPDISVLGYEVSDGSNNSVLATLTFSLD